MEAPIQHKELRPFPQFSPEGYKESAVSGISASDGGLPARAVTFGGLTLLDAFDKLKRDGHHKISAEDMSHGLVKLGKCESLDVAKKIASEMSQDWNEAKELDFEGFQDSVLEWGLR